MKKMMNKLSKLLLAIFMIVGSAPGIYGEETNEFHIASMKDWNTFVKESHVDAWSKDKIIYLDTDLDFEGASTYVSVLAGSFKGNHHTLSNITITGTGYSDGLFRYVSKEGHIEDLKVTNISVSYGEDQKRLGGLVGSNEGLIKNVSVSGSIFGKSQSGGIVGCNEASGIIDSAYMDGVVLGTYYTGGIAGKNLGTITNCTNDASVNTTKDWLDDDNSLEDVVTLVSNSDEARLVNGMDAGGIVGYSSGTIASCSNRGNVGYNHSGYNIGGIVGRQVGLVSNCENSGSVYGRKDVGGIAGQVEPYISINNAQSISKAVDTLHDLVNTMIDDAEDASNALNKDFNTLQSYSDGAIDDMDYLSGELTKFTDENIDEVNDVSGRVEYVSNNLPAVLDYTDSALKYLQYAAEDMSALSNDLDIEAAMKKSGTYAETDYNAITLVPSVGGTLTTNNTDPAKGAVVSVSASADSGYELSELYVVNASGSKQTLYSSSDLSSKLGTTTTATTAYFTMPSTHVVAYATFSFIGDYYITTSAGGSASVSKDGTTYTFSVRPNAAYNYELSSFTIDGVSVDTSAFSCTSSGSHVYGTNNTTTRNTKSEVCTLTIDTTSTSYTVPSTTNKSVAVDVKFTQSNIVMADTRVSATLNDDYEEDSATINYVNAKGGALAGTKAIAFDTLVDGSDEERTVSFVVTPVSGYRLDEDSVKVVYWNGSAYATSSITDTSSTISLAKVASNNGETTYQFIMPQASSEDVAAGAFVSASFIPEPVIITSNVGNGNHPLNSSNGTKYTSDGTNITVTVVPATGYSVSSIKASGDVSTNIPVTKTKANSYVYSYAVGSNSYTNFTITYKKQSSDYAVVKSAWNELQANSKALNTSLTNITNTTDAITTYISDKGYTSASAILGDSELNSMIFTDLLPEMNEAVKLANAMVSDATTLTTILTPYIEDSTSAASKDLSALSSDLESVAKYTRKANSEISSIVDYLNKQDDVEFSKFGEEFDTSLDSLMDELHGMNTTLSTINNHLNGYSNTVLEDFRKVNDQMNLIMDLLLDEMDLLEGDSIYEDISEDDLDGVNAKISDSVNTGYVEGNTNIGGIVGAMAIEEADNESNAAGDVDKSIGNKYQTKAMVLHSKSTGTISAKGDGVGGIVGLMRLGLVKECEAYMNIESEGDFVGGIAGESEGAILDSYAMSNLGGEKYIGGIAGYGSKIENCYAMPYVREGVSRIGAIAGQIAAMEEENEDRFANVLNNYYVAEDIYGIDDISYVGIAEPITYDELIVSEHVPVEFHHLYITLMVDHEVVDTIEVPYGTNLHTIDLPLVESAEGQYASWPALPMERMETTLYLSAEYNDNAKVLSSEESSDLGKAYAMIMGSFTNEASLHANLVKLSVPDNIKGNNDNITTLSVELDGTDYGEGDIFTLRLYNFGNEKAKVYCYDSEGWHEVEAKSVGSYLEVSMQGVANSYAIISEGIDISKIVMMGGIVLLVVLIVGAKIIHKRKKYKGKRKEVKETIEKDEVKEA